MWIAHLTAWVLAIPTHEVLNFCIPFYNQHGIVIFIVNTPKLKGNTTTLTLRWELENISHTWSGPWGTPSPVPSEHASNCMVPDQWRIPTHVYITFQIHTAEQMELLRHIQMCKASPFTIEQLFHVDLWMLLSVHIALVNKTYITLLEHFPSPDSWNSILDSLSLSWSFAIFRP